MKYNQLQESVIKVPPELMNKVNMYVASYLYFKIKQYTDRLDIMLSSNTSDEQKQKIKQDGQRAMQMLHQKYGAKNISSSTAVKLADNAVQLPVDFNKFFDELNFKGITPEMKQQLGQRLKAELTIKTRDANRYAGHANRDFDNLKIAVNAGRLNPKDFYNSANDIMNTAYHESQHAVQNAAIEEIDQMKSDYNKKVVNKQREVDPDYFNSTEKYYSSGVEFTPQLGDVCNLVANELEKDALNNNLNPNQNKAINNALVDVFTNDGGARNFLGSIRKNKPEEYKRALKTIFTKSAEVYQELKKNGIDFTYTDLPAEDLEANINVMNSVYQQFKEHPNDFEVEGTQRRGTASAIRAYSKNKKWDVTILPNGDGTYRVRFGYNHGEYDETVTLDAKQLLQFIGIIANSSWYEEDDVLFDLDRIYNDGNEVSTDEIETAIQQLMTEAEMLNVPHEYNGGTSFGLLGETFTVEPYPEEPSQVLIQSTTSNFYIYLSLVKFLMLFQATIRSAVNNPEEAIKTLMETFSFIGTMSKLRNL